MAEFRDPDKLALELDKHEFSPVVRHSDHIDDPLNWPLWHKMYLVGLVAILAFTANMSAALVNPAFVEMAKELNCSVEQASYCTTVFLLFVGITPLLLAPFANVYGRRILYIIFTIIAIVGNIVSAASPTYGGLIAGRALGGFGSSISLGFGAATICDLFTQGERGRYMGIYTVMMTNGPHIAPIAGGYIAQRLGWRWCFWIPAAIQGGLWLIVVFTFSETLFSRLDYSNLGEQSYWSKMLFHGKVLDRQIRTQDFGISLAMVKYLAVTLPCLYCSTANTYGSILFAVTGSHISATVYKFSIEQTGLFMGIPLTIGVFIGEGTTGYVSDLIINAYARRHNDYKKPEARLFLIPLTMLLCIGTAVFGYCVQHKKPWITSAICMGLSALGTQVATTMVYTYCTDSYKPQSAEIGAIINLFRSVFAFTVAFYALPFSEKAGYDVAFGTMAAINGVMLLPLVLLFFIGMSIREKQGIPKQHQDL